MDVVEAVEAVEAEEFAVEFPLTTMDVYDPV